MAPGRTTPRLADAQSTAGTDKERSITWPK